MLTTNIPISSFKISVKTIIFSPWPGSVLILLTIIIQPSIYFSTEFPEFNSTIQVIRGLNILGF